MEVKNNLEGDEGTFYIQKDAARVASLLYRLQGNDRMVIEHTEVVPEMEGKGLGKQLVDAAVSSAREKKIKIIPYQDFQRFLILKERIWKKSGCNK